MPRRAGILIPLFSLRTEGDWGIGEIPDLVPFSRWASHAGFSVVQMLPVNDVSPGQTSPYAARSAFALDPAYLALERVEDFMAAGGTKALGEEALRDLEKVRDSATVAWKTVRALKAAALQKAFDHFVATEGIRARAFNEYCRKHAAWLDDYALFVAIHEAHHQIYWLEWPEALRHRDAAALEEARARYANRIQFHRYVQWQLDLQWREARMEAERAGVALMGDLPFVVAGDSADVWARANEFRMDATAGAPPDDFSAEGQDWGLPVYRWDVMGSGDYQWMRERAERLAELFGLYRLDHIVGIYRTYFIPRDGSPKAFIPAEEHAQLLQGERIIQILALAKTPGEIAQSGRVIAEDLGVVPPFVRESLNRLGVAGYRVLRWEKDDLVFRDPMRWPTASVATTGTHDTESMAEWYDALPVHERAELLKLPALAMLNGDAERPFDDRIRDALLSAVYASPSELALIVFQDALGSRERINLPGTVAETNWVYRMPMPIAALALDSTLTRRLENLSLEFHRRVAPPAPAQ